MGFLSVKAYRMTKEAIKMFKEGDFSPESIKDLHISYESMFTQVPIIIKNSHLMNALLLEMQDQLPLTAGGTQYLDHDQELSFDERSVARNAGSVAPHSWRYPVSRS